MACQLTSQYTGFCLPSSQSVNTYSSYSWPPSMRNTWKNDGYQSKRLAMSKVSPLVCTDSLSLSLSLEYVTWSHLPTERQQKTKQKSKYTYPLFLSFLPSPSEISLICVYIVFSSEVLRKDLSPNISTDMPFTLSLCFSLSLSLSLPHPSLSLPTSSSSCPLCVSPLSVFLVHVLPVYRMSAERPFCWGESAPPGDSPTSPADWPETLWIGNRNMASLIIINSIIITVVNIINIFLFLPLPSPLLSLSVSHYHLDHYHHYCCSSCYLQLTGQKHSEQETEFSEFNTNHYYHHHHHHHHPSSSSRYHHHHHHHFHDL